MKKSLLLILFLVSASACLPLEYSHKIKKSGPVILPGGHTRPVTNIEFSSSGRYFATSSYDRVVKVWDSESYKVIANLWGHERAVFGLAFSTDGKILASAGGDETIRLWDWKNCKLLKQLKGHSKAVGPLKFHPNGKFIISAGDDRTICIWSYPEFQLLKRLKAHKRPILTLDLTPDGEYLLSSGFDGRVIAWRCEDWEEFRSWQMPAPVTGISFNESGNLFAVSLWNKTVQIRRFPEGSLKKVLKGHSGPVKGVSFSPHSPRMASVSWDGSLRIWDISTGKQTGIYYPQKGQELLAVAFNPVKPNQVLAGGWDYKSSPERVKHTDPSTSLSVWDIDKNTLVKNLSCQVSPILCAEFNPDDKILACGTQQTGLQLWDVKFGEDVSLDLKKVIGYHDPIYSLSFHPKKPYLAHTTVDAQVHIWNLEKLQKERVIDLQHYIENNPVLTSLDFSSDGKILAAGGDKKIFLIDLESGGIRHHYKGFTGRNRCLVFHPHRKIVAASYHNKIKIWKSHRDVKWGQLYKTLTGHKGEITALGFSPDGNYLCTIDEKGSVKIWNPFKGTEGTELVSWQLSYQNHALKGKIVAYHPEGGYLAAGSYTGEIAVYHLMKLKPIKVIKAHKDFIGDLEFSSDGQHLFSTGRDNTLKVWRFPEMDLIKTAAGTFNAEEIVIGPGNPVF